ncbi:hydrolase [Agrobacterium tumefaciens]|jgi:pimeloyl-ACP methyl ester carboxylesterase|uniref:Hydrolase n=1 Tax=Agrobacterium tumefaciens TaxID=358 RepID=A0A0D0L6L7_AGRTU|nr:MULTISPECIES: alpha/beta hydrolase [Agrobacterium]ADY67824.1 hydrolase protein [Agrobacterium tumefaciens]KIQ05470.1 hydrolase [Agrobacterium tumefaciens]UHS64393.1 alpha/beta hydrolase [Agrobacterium vaccinii]UXR94803.1 alpha/beta hydrolase [Agrobacterium tumefaciens]
MTLDTSRHPAVSVSVVLVHGAFVDASGWRQVYDTLSEEGYEVLVVQNSAVTFDQDVERTKSVIAEAKHPVVLVGHSYGGAVITEAGSEEQVLGLVYLAAFVPDVGESVFDLASQEVPGAEKAPLLAPNDGFIKIDPQKFAAAFSADIDLAEAQFMAAAQRPWGLEAVQGKITSAAWKAKPSFYLLAREDRMIPAQAQAAMAARAGATVVEVSSSHAVMLSQPKEVVALIRTAAKPNQQN